jgi:hypothetical protein
VPPFGLSRRPSLDSRSAFSTKSVPEGNGKIESISLQVAPLNKPPRRVERRFAASILSAAMDGGLLLPGHLRLCRSTRIISSSRGGKMPKIALRPFAVILALLTGLSARAASAAEIKVVCSGAMRAVLQQLAPAFEKSSGW